MIEKKHAQTKMLNISMVILFVFTCLRKQMVFIDVGTPHPSPTSSITV